MSQIPAVNESGMFRDYSYDISVNNLVLNAIRQCDQFQSSLAGDIVSADDRCGRVFEVLRVLTAGLLQDVVNGHNAIANFCLMHVHRWLLCKQALCYHPLLLRVVHRMTRIVLNSVSQSIEHYPQMCQELRRFGLHVIYADVNRLVVGTRRYTLPDSQQTIT